MKRIGSGLGFSSCDFAGTATADPRARDCCRSNSGSLAKFAAMRAGLVTRGQPVSPSELSLERQAAHASSLDDDDDSIARNAGVAPTG